jgi:hypothetical protein
MAQDWMALPHRKHVIRDLLIGDFIPLAPHDKFFEKLLATWQKHLGSDRKPIELRRMIESLRKSNYEFRDVDGRVVPVAFNQSPQDEAEDTKLSNRAAENLQFMTLPLKCRQLLDADKPIRADQVEPLANLIKSIHEKRGGPNESKVHTARDVVLAGVAVLICLQRDWLVANPDWLAWCRERLEEATKTPLARPRFYSDVNLGNDKWDAFAAECSMSLLARNRADALARLLVAQGVAGFFYSTTQLVVNRAARNHAALGDDFKRVIAAALEWSAIRPAINAFLPENIAEFERWAKRKELLEKRFVDGSLSPTLPDLKKLNADARKELDEIHAKRHPDSAAFLKARASRKATRKAASGSRIELYPERPGLDVRLITGLSWLRPDASTTFSRTEIIKTIKTLLDIVLDSIPKVTDRKEEEIRGLPSEFDGWVFKLVSTAIPLLTPAEKPENFWKPVLSLEASAHDWIERFFGSGLQRDRRPRPTSPISSVSGAR